MNYDNVIQKTLNELNRLYKQNTNNFFNEHYFHSTFFNIIFPELKELIRPEYPSYKGFKRRKKEISEDYNENDVALPDEGERYSFKKKGIYTRGQYDFVILKPEFYKENINDFDIISNKVNKKENPKTKPYISYVFEFKFFYKTIGKNGEKGIKFDLFKLKNAIEAEQKILIIFCKNLSQEDIGFVKNIKDSNITIYKYNEEGEIK